MGFDIMSFIFWGLPTILLIFFIVSLCLYISAKRKNKAVPDSFSVQQIRTRKILLIVSAVITGIFILIEVGFIALLAMAVANM